MQGESEEVYKGLLVLQGMFLFSRDDLLGLAKEVIREREAEEVDEAHRLEGPTAALPDPTPNREGNKQ